MSRLQDYTAYQLEESEMITRKLNPPLYNITKGMPWIAQRWPEIDQYLLTGNNYLMSVAYLEALLRTEVSYEPEIGQEAESEIEGYDISEDGQQESEDKALIFNPIDTTYQTSAKSRDINRQRSEDKGKS